MNAIPAGWESRTLGDLGRYLNGRAFKSSDWGTEGRPIIRIQNLTGSGDGFNYYSGDVDDRYVVRPGDLLVSWAATLGAYFWDGPEGVLNQHIFKVESNIDKRFHKYLIESKIAEMLAQTHGSGMVHITKSKFDSIPVAIPPLDEQRRIVTILEDHLSRLDAATGSLTSVGRLSQVFGRSGMHSALTSVPVEWRPLSAVLAGIEAGKSFTCLPRASEKGEWGVIKVSAMTWGEFRSGENKAVPAGKAINERFRIMRGDILVSRANTEQYVGAPVIVREQPDHLLLSDKSLRLLPADGVDRDWLIAVLQGPTTRDQVSSLATGTKDSMRNVSQGALLSVEVPVPVHDHDQQGVANAVAALHQARGHLESARQGVVRRGDALRRSLLNAAFSGQLSKETFLV